MKTFIMIGGRQCGKSTLATYEAAKDAENTLVIVWNESTGKYIKKEAKKKYDVDLTVRSSQGEGFIGKLFDKIVIDEYFYFPEQAKTNVINAIMGMCKPTTEIYIYSSLNNIEKDWTEVMSIQSDFPNAKVVHLTDDYRPHTFNLTFENEPIEISMPKILLGDLVKKYGKKNYPTVSKGFNHKEMNELVMDIIGKR